MLGDPGTLNNIFEKCICAFMYDTKVWCSSIILRGFRQWNSNSLPFTTITNENEAIKSPARLGLNVDVYAIIFSAKTFWLKKEAATGGVL